MEVGKGGEVRRIHIIYFLTLMGRSEEPHLIRVHHLARNGVYLRDVKRWVGELRGKDLAETYAWSYKRRYKTGYVWQDLLDDDLITPISDNEYVLKGSQIHPTPFETYILGEKKTSLFKEEIPLQVHDAEGKRHKQKQIFIREELQHQRLQDLKTNSQEKFSSEISSDFSTVTDENESYKVEEDKLVDTGKLNPDEQSRDKLENYSLHFSLYPSLLNRKGKNQSNRDNKTDTPETSFSISLSSSSSSPSPLKGSKRFSTGASGLIRNLITCGAFDSNNDVTVMLNQVDKNVSKNSNIKDNNEARIRKEDRFGGSARNLGSSWNLPQQEQQRQHHAARKSFDGKSTNKNKKKLGDFLNHISHRPFGGSIFSK